MAKKIILSSVFLVCSCSLVFGGNVVDNKIEDSTGVFAKNFDYTVFIPCARKADFRCLVNKADDVLENTRLNLLAEADAEAVQSTGRSDEDHSPSKLADVLSNLIGELSSIFSDGVSGLFRTGKDDSSDEEEEDQKTAADDKKDGQKAQSRSDVEESRGKKKKKIHKLINIIKLLTVGAVIKAKLGMLLKVLAFKLQIKFFLVALAGLALNAARFYLDLKKQKEPQKVIYYEHAQHQHHYEGGEDDWSSSGPGASGGHWGRSAESKAAQDLAYAKQKPADDQGLIGKYVNGWIN